MRFEDYAHYFVEEDSVEDAPPKVVQVDKSRKKMPGLIAQGKRPMPGLLPVARESDEIPSVVQVDDNDMPELISHSEEIPRVIQDNRQMNTTAPSKNVSDMLKKLQDTFASPRMPVSQSVDAANIAAGLKRGRQNVSHRQLDAKDTLVS